MDLSPVKRFDFLCVFLHRRLKNGSWNFVNSGQPIARLADRLSQSMAFEAKCSAHVYSVQTLMLDTHVDVQQCMLVCLVTREADVHFSLEYKVTCMNLLYLYSLLTL